MRRPKHTVSAVSDFACSASTVFRILTREQGYKNWFGFPKTENLVFIDPGFVPGAKLSFKGQDTFVITELRQDRKLSFSNSDYQVSFDIDLFDEGVSVSLTVDIFTISGQYEGVDMRLFCSETLRALKKETGAVSHTTFPEPKKEEPVSRSNIADFLVRVFAGYRRPVISSDSSSPGEVYSTIIENTEASVTIGRRALLFTLVLVCFFFFSIKISLSFQRSDIVPSSGLSLFENDNVNKYMSTLLRLGNEKQDLERKLSCQGERMINPDSSIEFHYTSKVKDSLGNACEHIYVIYDAYGRARKFAYIDFIQSASLLIREPSSRKLREDISYYEISDMNIKLSPSMNLYEVEEIIGVPVSAYIVEKNGESMITTMFFGKFVPDDIFKSNYKSQIIVVLNEAAGTTSVSYFNPIDEYDALPIKDLSRTLRRQYAGLDEFLSDRFNYEKIFLLNDITQEQVSLVLESKGFLIHSTVPAEDPDATLEETLPDEVDLQEIDENELDEPEEIIETYIYRVSNPFDESGTMPRNIYTVEYTDGIISSVLYRNVRLENYKGNTIGHLNNDSFSKGMTFAVATRIAGILPSAAEYNGNTVTLYYGQKIRDDRTGESSYMLKLTFVYGGKSLYKVEFYQAPIEEEIEEKLEQDVGKP